jgi:nitroreductase
VVRSLAGLAQSFVTILTEARAAGIAGQKIMLTAKAMGYGSCPMIGFDPVKVAEVINLPSDRVIGFMIAVGKAVKPAMSKCGQLPLSEVVMQDRFM